MGKWDSGALARFLETHSVEGYPVEVPIFGAGTIDKQIRPELGGFIFYRVIADTPIKFDTFAKKLNVPSTPMTLKEWEDQFAYGSRTFPAMASDLRDRLDAGEKVSRTDVLFRELVDRGCIDVDQNVFCHTFPSDDVKLRTPPQNGLGVEVYDQGEGKAGWPGRVVGYHPERGVVLVEQFAPVPFMQTPEAIDPQSIKPCLFNPFNPARS